MQNRGEVVALEGADDSEVLDHDEGAQHVKEVGVCFPVRAGEAVDDRQKVDVVGHNVRDLEVRLVHVRSDEGVELCEDVRRRE